MMMMVSVSDTLTITFTGDLLLDRGVRQRIEHRGVDHLFSPFVDSVFHSSDVVVANLECPATKIVQPNFKRFIFRAEPEWLKTLKAHGITHLNLANNHSIDQGRAGLTDTKKNIEEAGMIPVGAGENMQEAVQPVLLASSPRKVYLLSSCFIIVSLHWGGEHTLKPIPLQRQQAHDLIDAGADALICHHTHTLQTIEQYQGKPIYYSIGNFIFDQHKPLNTRACMVKVTVTKDDAHFETIPIIINNCIPEEGGTRREKRGVRSEEGGATFVLRPLTFVL